MAQHSSNRQDEFRFQFSALNTFQTYHLEVEIVISLFLYDEGLLAPSPTLQARGPLLVVFPRLLIQDIRSYPP
jgi:hypothetical protein